MWGLSEVANALRGAACCYNNCAVGIGTKSRGRPVCSCSGCASGTGGGISFALSGKSWNEQQSKRKQSLTFKNVYFFYSHQSLLQIFEIDYQLRRPLFLKKMNYLADHLREKKSRMNTQNQYSGSITFTTGLFRAQHLSTFPESLILMCLLQIVHILHSATE